MSAYRRAAKVHCGCNNGGDAAAYQDKMYGRGVRIANPAGPKAQGGVPKGQCKVHCTLCKREHVVSDANL
jgi:hypothetical protein